jgi:hypothetical protein
VKWARQTAIAHLESVINLAEGIGALPHSLTAAIWSPRCRGTDRGCDNAGMAEHYLDMLEHA